ncbi:hypothetical protein AAEX28_12070 [Lentisphaerota bacterium WC36G]|nr:hypothetical protein LJT99_14905 [Lentisphaerae bacterium WC36]
MKKRNKKLTKKLCENFLAAKIKVNQYPSRIPVSFNKSSHYLFGYHDNSKTTRKELAKDILKIIKQEN